MKHYFLRVALWQLPTMVSNAPDGAPNNVEHLSHDERCRQLEERLAAANALFEGMAAPAGATVVDLFAAPEYLFADSATRHFVDAPTKDRILEKIRAMTLRYPNILLFPGTVAWKKPMHETRTFLNKDRSRRAHRRLDSMTNKYATGKGNYDQHKNRLTAALANDDEVYYAQNTAYVMRRGKVVLKYHKMADGGEVFREDREDAMVVWVPGNRKGTFTLDGLKFGLEICAERSARMLDVWNVGDVDVHVMIAASNKPSPNTASISQDGYLLHADSNLPPAAYQRKGGGSQIVAPRHSFPALGGKVSYYGLDFAK